MIQVHAKIELLSGEDMIYVRRGKLAMDKVKSITITALVDKRFPYMAINEKIRDYLQLWVVDQRPFRMANGEVVHYDLVGPLEILFENRHAFCDAIVLPGHAEPILGLVPIGLMDVLVDPVRQELVVNPKHPDYAMHRI